MPLSDSAIPDRIASELEEETLLALEQFSTAVTELAINATREPEQCLWVRRNWGLIGG